MDATTIQRSTLGARSRAAGHDGGAAAAGPAEVGDRVTRGTVAGLAAGLVFLLANMLWATKASRGSTTGRTAKPPV
jgi:hypothetical protein